jgi:hypothetical protein
MPIVPLDTLIASHVLAVAARTRWRRLLGGLRALGNWPPARPRSMPPGPGSAARLWALALVAQMPLYLRHVDARKRC